MRADLVGLDAFRDGRDRQRARKLCDGLDHGLGARVRQDVAGEAAIDLEHRHGQRTQVGQRGQPGPEVVERHAAAELAHASHQQLGLGHVAHGVAFGDLEAQQRGIEAAALQPADQEIRETLVVQRLPGQVDADAHVPLEQRGRKRLELHDGLFHDPAIHQRHQPIALHGPQEPVGPDRLATGPGHAQQDLEVRERARAAGRHSLHRLCIQPQAPGLDHLAQVIRAGDVGGPPDDVQVGVPVDLDAVASPLLAYAARGFGDRHGMRQRISTRFELRDAQRHGDRQARAPVHDAQLAQALAHDLGHAAGILVLHGQHDGEPVARDPCRDAVRRQAAAQELRDARQHLIAGRHAVFFVDPVQLVAVDVQQAPVARLAGNGERGTGAAFQGLARQQAAERIEAGIHAAADLAREQLEHAAVAVQEFRALDLAEQREQSRDPSRGILHRAAEDAIGKLLALADQAIDRNRLAPGLHQLHELLVGARHQRAVGHLAVAGAHHRDVLVRDHERRQHAPQVLDGVLQQRLELVGGFPGLADALVGNRQQHLDVLVARGKRMMQVQQRTAAGEFAAQAFHRGMHQRVDELEAALVGLRRLAHRNRHRGEEMVLVVTQPPEIGGQFLAFELQRTPGERGILQRFRLQFLDGARQIGPGGGGAGPAQPALGVEHPHGIRARHEPHDELRVRLECLPCVLLGRQVDGHRFRLARWAVAAQDEPRSRFCDGGSRGRRPPCVDGVGRLHNGIGVL